ncbi:hypothetical protein SAMN05216583_103182 [Selenomonas sp. KH1T6]|nr:hypothetical protein SAMN05216583_103182 [Selenomonas ruminantium]
MCGMLDYICQEYGFPESLDEKNADQNKKIESVDVVARKVAIWFLVNNYEGYTEDTLKRSFRRHRNDLDMLYCFYEQGMKCFRSELYYLDDFQQAAFFEPESERCDFIKGELRQTYIKSILAVVLIVLGWEKVFPMEFEGNEKKISLHKILREYTMGTHVDNKGYAKNGTYYLLWNCLNEILEWGFEGAKNINDFRKNVFLPHCHNIGFGLTDDEEIVSASIDMDKICRGVFLDYEAWLHNSGTCIEALLEERCKSDNPIPKDIFDDLSRRFDIENIIGLGGRSFSEIKNQMNSNTFDLPIIKRR